MSALQFPDNPTLNEEYTHQDTGIVYYWNGVQWRLKPVSNSAGGYTLYPAAENAGNGFYTYIGYIEFQDFNVNNHVNEVVLRVMGSKEDTSDINSSELYISRSSQEAVEYIRYGDYTSSYFLTFNVPHQAGNRIEVYLYNGNTRGEMVIQTDFDKYVHLDNTQPVLTGLPDTDFGSGLVSPIPYSFKIPQRKTLDDSDLLRILNNSIIAFNSVSIALEQQVRPLYNTTQGG